MPYSIIWAYTDWKGRKHSGRSDFPDAESAGKAIVFWMRDGVQDLSIFGPDGKKISQDELARIEVRERRGPDNA